MYYSSVASGCKFCHYAGENVSQNSVSRPFIHGIIRKIPLVSWQNLHIRGLCYLAPGVTNIGNEPRWGEMREHDRKCKPARLEFPEPKASNQVSDGSRSCDSPQKRGTAKVRTGVALEGSFAHVPPPRQCATRGARAGYTARYTRCALLLTSRPGLAEGGFDDPASSLALSMMRARW